MRLRFHLKDLFILVTLIAMMLGWLLSIQKSYNYGWSQAQKSMEARQNESYIRLLYLQSRMVDIEKTVGIASPYHEPDMQVKVTSQP